MRKVAKYWIIVWVLSLPFQWIYLGNYIFCGINTLVCIDLIVLYIYNNKLN